MSRYQNSLNNLSKGSGSRIYFSAQGPSGAVGGSTVKEHGDDERPGPMGNHGSNSSMLNFCLQTAQATVGSNSGQPENTLAAIEDESEEESDTDVAPDLALRVTDTNLAAVLRLDSDIRYLDELLQTYISLDIVCRESK